jgi:uncharacterized membrane protein YfcA
MMHFLIGFTIALTVGLTGIGGGSFTVPALILIVGLPAGEAVGTAFVFAGVLRLIAAPFYMLNKEFHAQYLWLLLKGAVPGLLLGTYVLRVVSRSAGSPVVVILLGILLALSSGVTFAPRAQNPGFALRKAHWLPWLAFPIGVESGFSSAGAGALGAVLLLNYSEISPAQVVGTDLLFGFVLAAIGSAFHWQFGSISSQVLLELLAGGVPGVVLGCRLAPSVPPQKLRTAVAMIAMFAGIQLVWSGARTLTARRSTGLSTAMKLPFAPSERDRLPMTARGGRAVPSSQRSIETLCPPESTGTRPEFKRRVLKVLPDSAAVFLDHQRGFSTSFFETCLRCCC